MIPFPAPVPAITPEQARRREMAAYDGLPPRVREAVANASVGITAAAAADALRHVNAECFVAWLNEAGRQKQARFEAQLKGDIPWHA